MGVAPAVLSLLALALLCTLVGRALAKMLGQSSVTHELALLFGLLVLHTWMVLSSGLGIGWSRVTLFIPLVSVVILAVTWSARRSAHSQGPSQFPGISLEELGVVRLLTGGILFLIVGLFLRWAYGLKLVHADFMYHWGVKGERFFLHRGIDWDYLALPENGIYHPDYPLLVPDLYAALAVGRGHFDDRAQQLWAGLFLIVLVSSCVRYLDARGSGHWTGSVAAIGVVAATAAFGLAYFQAGGPDLPFSALFLVATVEISNLTASGGNRAHQGVADGSALRVGVLAALLAACKLEGLFAATALVGLAGAALFLRSRRSGAQLATGLRTTAGTALALVLPLLISAGPWLLGVRRYDLFQSASNTGQIRLENLASILSAMWEVLLMPQWQGLCLVVLITPLLMFSRRSRWAAVFILLQLAFYGYAYLTSPHEPVFFVKSNFPRLLYHVVPSVCLVALGWLVSRERVPALEHHA